jgi:Protein of unknown function (DUF1761)
MNYLVIFGTALVPLIVGFIWYNNAFGFGKAWMAATGLKEEDLQRDFSPVKVYGSAYLLGIFLAVAMMPMTIHQMGLSSMLMGVDGVMERTSEAGKAFGYLMDTYGANFRTFKHGAFHGLINGIFLALPIIAISALFERRSWKYIFIHLGYWMITMAIMGGLICQFLDLK